MTEPTDRPESGYFSEESATFGDRLAGARRAVGLTQEICSHTMGVKLKTLQAWEEDMSEPRANKLQMLAGVLNVSIIWLLTGEVVGVRDPWNADDAADGGKTAEVIADIRAIRAENRRLGERLLHLEKKLASAGRK